ncbi:MAG: hypothetical protein ACLVEJ_19790 [Parabacteroides sp.]
MKKVSVTNNVATLYRKPKRVKIIIISGTIVEIQHPKIFQLIMSFAMALLDVSNCFIVTSWLDLKCARKKHMLSRVNVVLPAPAPGNRMLR